MSVLVEGFQFWILGLRFWFRVKGLWCWVFCLGFGSWVLGLGLQFSLGLKVLGQVLGLGFRVFGLGFLV